MLQLLTTDANSKMAAWLIFAIITYGAASSTAAGCGGSLEGQGTFTSPNHPMSYPSNAYCIWTLTADAGKSLTLRFMAFDVELDMRCSYDSVKVYNGPVSSGTLIGRYCGSDLPAAITGFQTLTVVFTSDIAYELAGFSASFESVPATGGGDGDAKTTTTSGRLPTAGATAPPATGGGGSCGNYAGSTGVLHSPNYPNNYPSSTSCSYTITVPKSRVVLTFDMLDIESSAHCTFDYLEIRDGDANGNVLARVCGSANPGSVTSSGTRLHLKFFSDSTLEQTGFHATWQELTCEIKGGACAAAGACDGRNDSTVPCDEAGAVCCIPKVQRGACGVQPTSRIIGGNESVPHSWPWQASLQLSNSNFHYCGATVITPEWLVTAAHCVDGTPTDSMHVVVGEHDLTKPDHEQVLKIQSYIMHEDYDQKGDGFPNDIALIKLTSPILFNRYVQPACLPELDEEFVPGDECWITGWGDTKGTANQNLLNQLKVDLLTRPFCRTLWGDTYIREGHVCLGNGLKGSCNGDSGGPLVCRRLRNGMYRWVLAGSTSWGQVGCQTEGKPSVYVRVSYYYDWIDKKILGRL